jgi:hypothetical protein
MPLFAAFSTSRIAVTGTFPMPRPSITNPFKPVASAQRRGCAKWASQRGACHGTPSSLSLVRRRTNTMPRWQKHAGRRPKAIGVVFDEPYRRRHRQWPTALNGKREQVHFSPANKEANPNIRTYRWFVPPIHAHEILPSQ